MKLLLIHGRDQQGENPDDLKASWLRAWELGLRKNNLSIPNNLEIVFPFYGDLLDQLVREEASKPSSRGFGNEPFSDPEDNFYRQVINEIAGNAGIEIEEGTDQRRRGLENTQVVRSIVKKLEALGLGDAILKVLTKDAFMYLKNKRIGRKINEYIGAQITQDDYVVVGHSLGSAVGYNILHEHPGIHVKAYITVGSPLGISPFKVSVTRPISLPTCIKGNWHNLFDERDIVALRPLDSTYFPITPAILNNNHVRNHTDNRHGIEGYLDDAIVAKKIYEALST